MTPLDWALFGIGLFMSILISFVSLALICMEAQRWRKR